jgi:hypothetical protein
MVNVVETIGGDGASLTQWKDEIPKAIETAISILGMVEYLDPDYKPGTLTENFLNRFTNK